jgi:hypothetical protein
MTGDEVIGWWYDGVTNARSVSLSDHFPTIR